MLGDGVDLVVLFVLASIEKIVEVDQRALGDQRAKGREMIFEDLLLQGIGSVLSIFQEVHLKGDHCSRLQRRSIEEHFAHGVAVLLRDAHELALFFLRVFADVQMEISLSQSVDLVDVADEGLEFVLVVRPGEIHLEENFFDGPLNEQRFAFLLLFLGQFRRFEVTQKNHRAVLQWMLTHEHQRVRGQLIGCQASVALRGESRVKTIEDSLGVNQTLQLISGPFHVGPSLVNHVDVVRNELVVATVRAGRRARHGDERRASEQIGQRATLDRTGIVVRLIVEKDLTLPRSNESLQAKQRAESHPPVSANHVHQVVRQTRVQRLADQSVDAEFVDELVIDRFAVGEQLAENVEVRIDASRVVHQVLGDVQRGRVTIVQPGAVEGRGNQSGVFFHVRPEVRRVAFATAEVQLDDVRPLIQFSPKINIRPVNVLGEVSQRVVVHHPTVVRHDTFEELLLVRVERCFDLLRTGLEHFLVRIGEVVADERRTKRNRRVTWTEGIEEVELTAAQTVVNGQLKVQFDQRAFVMIQVSQAILERFTGFGDRPIGTVEDLASFGQVDPTSITSETAVINPKGVLLLVVVHRGRRTFLRDGSSE